MKVLAINIFNLSACVKHKRDRNSLFSVAQRAILLLLGDKMPCEVAPRRKGHACCKRNIRKEINLPKTAELYILTGTMESLF